MLDSVQQRLGLRPHRETTRVIEVINEKVTTHYVTRDEGVTEFEFTKHVAAAANTIVSLDHTVVTSVQAPVIVTRQDAKAPITDSEFENILSQALWKLFNQQRARAAAKMQCADVEVRLMDSDVLSVKLDEHRSINPVGFSARTIELCLREALVHGSRFEALTRELAPEEISATFEAPLTPAGIIARLTPDASFLYVSVDNHQTVLYRYHDHRLTYLDSLMWGSRDILRAISELLLVDEHESRLILERYVRGAASLAVLKHIESALSSELAILLKAIESHRVTGSREPVYVHSFFDISSLVFESRFIKRLQISASLISVDERYISEKTGFTLKLHTESPRDRYATLLASLALAYGPSEYGAVSKIAKRRVRWLTSNH